MYGPMKLWISLVFLSFALTAGAGERFWFEQLYKSSKLEREFARVSKKYPDQKLAQIFSGARITCESNVIADLSELRAGDIKYALFLANKKGFIDEVELDILLVYARALDDVSLRLPEAQVRVQQGHEVIERHYQGLASGEGCLETKWQSFADAITIKITNEKLSDQEVLTALNHQAMQERTIDRKLYLQLEMLNLLGPQRLTIASYREMRERLRGEGFELNEDVSAFARSKKDKNKMGLRYRLYSNFSLLQMKEMLELLKRFTERSEADSSSIVFFDENEQAQESIELGPTEQLRLSMKLFSREKKQLLLKPYFSGKGFSYRDLITLAYETKRVDEQGLDFLKMLEKETQKRSFLQNAVGTASRYSFVATLLVGPTAGFVYALGITIANNYLNRDQAESPQYEHDIFYGNCQEGLR